MRAVLPCGTALFGAFTMTAATGAKASSKSIFSPVPRMRAARLTMHTGTSAPSPVANACQLTPSQESPVGLLNEPQQRRGVGRTAAKSGRNRNLLDQRDRPEAEFRIVFGDKRERLVEQVCACERGGERARDVDARRRTDRQHQTITLVREHDETVELMIAVGPAAMNLEREIDLDPGDILEHRHGCQLSKRKRAHYPVRAF